MDLQSVGLLKLIPEPQSNPLIRDETCDQGKLLCFNLWQNSTPFNIVMDISQIKNVAFSLGELPSNVIRLNYYSRNFSSTRPTIYWRFSSRNRFSTCSVHYLPIPICSLPDIHPSRNERKLLFKHSSTFLMDVFAVDTIWCEEGRLGGRHWRYRWNRKGICFATSKIRV